MRLSRCLMLTGVAAAALGLATLPAAAAPKRATVVAQNTAAPSHVHTRRVRQPRARTRITVRRRSFLDPGTGSIPGESKQLDYAVLPSHVPGQVLSGPSAPAGWQNPWYPLPGPFFPWPP